MKTTIITVDEAIVNGTYKWEKTENDCEFKGYVPGYVCGWCVEVKKQNGEIGYCSMTCTNDFDEIKDPNSCTDWNELGISANCAFYNGWVPTGNIVFRGYFEEYYDYDEREDFVKDASKEVIGLFNKYCVA